MLIIRAAALTVFCVFALLTAPGARAAGPEDATDWSAALERDARAFHAAIAARHPGPVDPENPGFR
ncbi:MAG: hypothetical protein GX538_06040, partial [Gammaproteobacteria bacterium]|nr:hypothetical protein [Gammaproteobacteria bacterium]